MYVHTYLYVLAVQTFFHQTYKKAKPNKGYTELDTKPCRHGIPSLW